MSGEVAAALGQLGLVLLVLLIIGAISWSAYWITRRLERSSRTAGREAEPSLASLLESTRGSLRPYPGATRAYRGGLATGIGILFYAGAMPLGCFT